MTFLKDKNTEKQLKAIKVHTVSTRSLNNEEKTQRRDCNIARTYRKACRFLVS